MELMKLILGVILLAAFTWLLIRNSKRKGFIHTLFGIDIIFGLAAGIYLVVSSVNALWIG